MGAPKFRKAVAFTVAAIMMYGSLKKEFLQNSNFKQIFKVSKKEPLMMDDDLGLSSPKRGGFTHQHTPTNKRDRTQQQQQPTTPPNSIVIQNNIDTMPCSPSSSSSSSRGGCCCCCSFSRRIVPLAVLMRTTISLLFFLLCCLVSDHCHAAFSSSPTSSPTLAAAHGAISRRTAAAFFSSFSSSSMISARAAEVLLAATSSSSCCETTYDAPGTSRKTAAAFLNNAYNEQDDDDEDGSPSTTTSGDDDDDDDILISLFGSQQVRDEFMHQWRQDDETVFHHHIRRPTQTTGSSSVPPPPPLSGIDMRSLYETSRFISLRIRGSHDLLDKNTTSYEDLCQYISSGGSAIVSIVDESDYMHPFKVQLQKALGIQDAEQVSMNVYHSGPSAVALNLHYDSYNVIVLQLAGQKEWMLQNDDDDANGPRRQPLDSISKWQNVTMMPGDVLYIPKGVFHAATTKQSLESTTSTHVTIGLVDGWIR
jgi:Cupin superfamily protein